MSPVWNGRRFEGVAAVLFDLDGTLVETHIDFPAMRRAITELAVAAGVPEAALEGLDILERVALTVATVSNPEPFREAAEAAMTALELEACARAIEMPGAIGVMEALLAHGVRVGIVTRNCRRVVGVILERVPLPHEVLFTRDEVARVKPDPSHLWQALDALGVAAARAVMVGDHLMDVRGGRAAGMGTVGFLAPGRPPEFFAPEAPDLVIRELDELLSWISPSSS